MTTSGEICVFCERDDVALELLAAGRKVAGKRALVSVVTGPEAMARAEQHAARGADVVVVVESPSATDSLEQTLSALTDIVGRRDPAALLLGATTQGIEIASRLAQRLGVGCASECTDLEWRDGGLQVERTCLGRFVARQLVETRPAVATVQARRFEPPDRCDSTGRIETLSVENTATELETVETRQRPPSAVRIDRAEVIVGVGRGLRNREDLNMIERLAEVLGGVVGASRPLTDDLQWLPPERKIGLSGLTVKPRLYIACGISGQVEHNVGMRESGVIVAINSDPAAPIMEQADYCLEGDLHEIVPALIESIGRVAGR